MNENNNKILNSIQILRGLAALSVVLYHYSFRLVPDGGDISKRAFSWGGIGVDLFFVISGFIMILVTQHYKPGVESSKRFIVNRLTRVLPVYYVILLFAFIMGGAMSTFHYSEKTINLISALTFLPYVHDTAPMYIQSNGMFNIRWTLSFELYFYFIFSICLLYKNKLLPLCLWFLAPLVLCPLITGGFTLHSSGYNFNNVYLEFLTNPIILEFGFGVVAGLLYMHMKKLNIQTNPTILLIIIAAIAFAINQKILTMYSLLTGISFSLLVLSLSLSEHLLKGMPFKILAHLGNISFSLYLLHSPLGSFASKKVEKFSPGLMHSPLGVTAMVFAAILAAHFSHKYLEIKLSGFIKSKIESKLFNKAALIK